MADTISNLKADSVSVEMEQVTAAKFAKWDLVVAENWMDSPYISKQTEAFKMLSDPTVYAYAFFKDKDGNPLRFHSYQDMIINDDSKRVMFVASNQVGKSYCLCYIALYYALNNPGHTVLMTSKTLPQAKDLLRQIKSFLKNCSLEYKYDIGDSDTKTEIYFKHTADDGTELNQSRIVCVPATEAALGYAANLLLVDELAFYDDGEYFYKQIAQPRTYATKGKIIVFSNPNGEMGIFHELWTGKRFNKYRFNFLDNPNNTQQEFDELCDELPQEQIDSTLMAIFTSAAGGFLTVKERQSLFEERSNVLPSVFTHPVTICYDFAKTQDRTVREVGIPTEFEGKKGVYIYEVKEYPQNTEYTEILRELKELIEEYGAANIDVVAFEQLSVGHMDMCSCS